MKNINKILIAFIAVLVVSCTADAVDNRPVIESISTSEMLTPENNMAFVLTEANAANVADRFTWTKAKYSSDVVVQYTLLIDIKGGDFTSATTIGTTSDINQLTVLVKDLNEIAIELGAVAGEDNFFDIKVKSSVSGAVIMISKTPITISINPFISVVANNCPNQYAVGDGIVSAGWGWASPLTLICNDKILVSTVDLANDTFRFFTTSADWGSGRNYPWYVTEGYKISSNLENANDGDSNFKFTGTPGIHRIAIDENSKTITLVQGETAANSFWLVGEATPGGWSWSANNETELGLIKDGVYEVLLTLKSGEAFRVFLGNNGTDDGNWDANHNFPYYVGEGYTISSELVNAEDGDKNFKYTGTTGIRIFKIDTIAKTITLN